jgi:hypothetical protein
MKVLQKIKPFNDIIILKRNSLPIFEEDINLYALHPTRFILSFIEVFIFYIFACIYLYSFFNSILILMIGIVSLIIFKYFVLKQEIKIQTQISQLIFKKITTHVKKEDSKIKNTYINEIVTSTSLIKVIPFIKYLKNSYSSMFYNFFTSVVSIENKSIYSSQCIFNKLTTETPSKFNNAINRAPVKAMSLYTFLFILLFVFIMSILLSEKLIPYFNTNHIFRFYDINIIPFFIIIMTGFAHIFLKLLYLYQKNLETIYFTCLYTQLIHPKKIKHGLNFFIMNFILHHNIFDDLVDIKYSYKKNKVKINKDQLGSQINQKKIKIAAATFNKNSKRDFSKEKIEIFLSKMGFSEDEIFLGHRQYKNINKIKNDKIIKHMIHFIHLHLEKGHSLNNIQQFLQSKKYDDNLIRKAIDLSGN